MENDNSENPQNPVFKPAEQTAKKTKSKPTGLIILILFIVISLAFASYAAFGTKNDFYLPESQSEQIKPFFLSPENSKKQNPAKTAKSGYIAKIFITGIIQESNNTYNQKWLLETIDDLACDENNKGIILFVDSPGGSVYESDEAYCALLEYQETGKPVWAYLGSMAASGGYYISCGAERIFANRNTLTGSIGVIAGESLDLTELMQKLGIKSKTFTAGKNKNMLNFNSPLTEEQENIMLSVANECYDQFTSIVADSRNLDIETVRNLADGRIYTAKQALNLKLIDKIGTFEDAADDMKKLLENEDLPVIDYQYMPKFTWYDFLTNALTHAGKLTQSTEGKIIDMLSSDIKYPAYLYK